MRTHKEVMATINAIGAPVSLTEVKRDGRFIGVGMNFLMEEFTGTSNENFEGRDLEDVTGISDIRKSRSQRSVSNFRRCIELGSQITIETELEREDRTSVWGRHTIVPIFNKFGKICLLMATSIDITELKNTREKLENSLTRVLSGFVKICATCKDIRNDSNQWVRVERYLDNDNHDVKFSHGYCPKCFDLAMAELR